MTNYERAESLAREITIWNAPQIISTVAKVSFSLWGGNWPRDFEMIICEFSCKLKRHEFIRTVVEMEYVETSASELTKRIREILFSIPEFKKWNLTEAKYINGVDPDPLGRISKHYKPGDFFIDLDAFILNIYNELRDSLVAERYYDYSEGEVV